MRPCMAAVEASIQPPVTSPAAEMRSFEVRQQPLIAISPRGPTSTPTDSRPSSSVCARMPMQMIACVPVKWRPSSAVARTRSPSRSTSEARAFSSIAMPRSRKASCTTSATSRSSVGRICGRDESSVTREPQLWKNSANSQPVAPAPTTSSCSGSVVRGRARRAC